MCYCVNIDYYNMNGLFVYKGINCINIVVKDFQEDYIVISFVVLIKEYSVFGVDLMMYL